MTIHKRSGDNIPTQDPAVGDGKGKKKDKEKVRTSSGTSEWIGAPTSVKGETSMKVFNVIYN